MYPPKRRAPQTGRSERKPEPKVGIFFVVGDTILLEATGVSNGEPYGDSIGHERGHSQFWEDLVKQGQVDKDLDYIAVPRGRSTFLAPTGQFLLLLDRCILRRPALVREIRRKLNLPTRLLRISSDDHYRCSRCFGEQDE